MEAMEDKSIVEILNYTDKIIIDDTNINNIIVEFYNNNDEKLTYVNLTNNESSKLVKYIIDNSKDISIYNYNLDTLIIPSNTQLYKDIQK